MQIKSPDQFAVHYVILMDKTCSHRELKKILRVDQKA